MTTTRKRSQKVLTQMPDKTVTVLGFVAAGLVVAYIGLIIATVYFASWQTSLAAEVRDTEGSIATLETTYYTSMSRVSATAPSTLGLVAPKEVRYAQAQNAGALTFAGK